MRTLSGLRAELGPQKFRDLVEQVESRGDIDSSARSISVLDEHINDESEGDSTLNPQDGGGSPGQCSPGRLLYEPTERLEVFDFGGLEMETSNFVQEEQCLDSGFHFLDAFSFDDSSASFDSDKFYSASE